MAEAFKMPPIGEDTQEASVIDVLVSEGDSIEKDQDIVELETDKATFEVPCSIAGKVSKVHISKGDTIHVGDTIISIETEQKQQEDKPDDSEKTKDEGTDRDEEADTQHKQNDKEKQSSEEDTRPVDQDSDESQEEQQEDKTETAESQSAQESDSPEEERDAKSSKVSEEAGGDRDSDEPEPRESDTQRTPVIAAPSARRLASELGLTIEDVPCEDDHVTIDDVKRHARNVIRSHIQQREDEQLPDLESWGDVEKRNLSGIRQRIAERMTTSWRSTPHVTLCDKADMTELDKQRRGLAEQDGERDNSPSLTAVFLKILAAGLIAHPHLRESIDPRNEQVIRKQYCHIGVAVDTEYGLLVPVVRDVDRKSITELDEELSGLAERARNRDLKPDEMKGGVCSLSNLGGIGAEYFTPIINPPDTAVLGLGRARMEPTFNPETEHFRPRLMIPLSLSFDHRVVDGAEAARFMAWLTSAIEQPLLITLGS